MEGQYLKASKIEKSADQRTLILRALQKTPLDLLNSPLQNNSLRSDPKNALSDTMRLSSDSLHFSESDDDIPYQQTWKGLDDSQASQSLSQPSHLNLLTPIYSLASQERLSNLENQHTLIPIRTKKNDAIPEPAYPSPNQENDKTKPNQNSAPPSPNFFDPSHQQSNELTRKIVMEHYPNHVPRQDLQACLNKILSMRTRVSVAAQLGLTSSVISTFAQRSPEQYEKFISKPSKVRDVLESWFQQLYHMGNLFASFLFHCFYLFSVDSTLTII